MSSSRSSRPSQGSFTRGANRGTSRITVGSGDMFGSGSSRGSYGGGPAASGATGRPRNTYVGGGKNNHKPINTVNVSRGVSASRGASGPRGSRGSRDTYVRNRGGAPRTSSVRLGDLNSSRGRSSRNVTSRGGRVQVSSGAFGKLLMVLAIIAVLVIGYMALYFSPLFKIANINIEGGEHVTQEQILEAAQIPAGVTMLRVDAAAIKHNIESIGWVSEASVSTMIPDTLNISIQEQTIEAVAEISSKDAKKTEVWGISSDGTWLMRIPDKDSDEAKNISAQVYEDAEKVLHITGVPYGVVPEEGAACVDENVNNALSIISNMTTELADQVKVVSADGTETTTLVLKNGVEIAFGDGSDVRDKERVCLSLLKKHKDSIAYINVRTVNRPTWRAL